MQLLLSSEKYFQQVPVSIKRTHAACERAVALYRSELWWKEAVYGGSRVLAQGTGGRECEGLDSSAGSEEHRERRVSALLGFRRYMSKRLRERRQDSTKREVRPPLHTPAGAPPNSEPRSLNQAPNPRLLLR
jgi:hypothetical protein